MDGGPKDWSGMVMVSGVASDLSRMSSTVEVGRTRIDAGATLVFLGICTGLILTASRSRVTVFLSDLASKTPARS